MDEFVRHDGVALGSSSGQRNDEEASVPIIPENLGNISYDDDFGFQPFEAGYT